MRGTKAKRLRKQARDILPDGTNSYNLSGTYWGPAWRRYYRHLKKGH